MRRLIFLISVLLLVVSGVGLAATVNIAIPTDPDTFDPPKATAAATGEIAFNIYEGLVKATPDGDIVPALATHWEVDSDNMRYVFYLREAYFHNGERVTASDVVSALERVRDPNVSNRAGEYGAIDTVEAEGDRVIVTLKQPYSPFLYTLSELSAAIYPEGAEGLDSRPIGTGPYRLTEWRPNQSIRLERFDHHWSDELPYFERANLQIMPDDSSSVLSLRTGHIDIIPRMEPSLLHQVEGNSSLKVVTNPMNLVQLLAINNKREPFNDLRVRQAIALAIDREEIILGAAWGHGDPLSSGISPAMEQFFHEGLAGTYPHNPVKAREILKDAGYEGLQVRLDLPAPYAIHVQTGEIIAQQLEDVGFTVDIHIIEWGTWLERIYQQRDYDLTIVGLSGRLDAHSILVRYQSESSRNFFNFDNPAYDKLIAEGLEASWDEQIAIYRKAQEILTQEVAGVFLMDPSQLAVMDQGILGWKNYPIYVIDIASLYRD